MMEINLRPFSHVFFHNDLRWKPCDERPPNRLHFYLERFGSFEGLDVTIYPSAARVVFDSTTPPFRVFTTYILFSFHASKR